MSDFFTEKEMKHISKLIKSEISYFNGWSVSDKALDDACSAASKKINKYLSKKIMALAEK